MALKPKELRTGNFVQKDAEVYKADFITIRMAQNYDPIPLTEEWLVRFGFEKEPLGFGKSIAWHKDHYKVLSFSSDYLYLREGDSDNRTEDVLICLWNKDIKKQFYVHELQNLFHALTGEELTIPTPAAAGLN